MRIFILEDDVNRVDTFKRALVGHELTVVDTAEDAIETLRNERFNLLFLDHDLGGETYVDTNNKNTGSEVARAICGEKLVNPGISIIIHSLNHPAAKSMHQTLLNGDFTCAMIIPFTQLLSNYLDDPSFLK